MAEGDEKRSALAVQTDYVSKIIAAINPSMFISHPADQKKISKLSADDFWTAVDEAKASPGAEYKLVYDSPSETLEPVYFFILDMMNGMFGGKVEKLVDNFASSPGGGHFAEMGMRATKMQEEGMKIMQTVGVLVKSLVNIIYDLREFELRLSQYKAANSKDKAEAEAGLLALKQIWMDNVDIKRGRGSINMLAQDLQFVTLRDAFMAADSIEKIKSLDLNDRVIRLLQPRLQEFLKWRELSESELRKRYSIERSYLKSQVSSLQMYTRWAKPYLRAASQLQQTAMKNPALVTAFDTTILQLSIIGKNKFKFEDAVIDKKLPAAFKKAPPKRDYNSCVLVDFVYRGIPQRSGQHYTFGGKVEVTFRSFALNSEELKILDKMLAQSDLNDALKLAEGMTSESLDILKSDIDYFTKELDEREKEGKKEREVEKKGDDVNPFLALFGLGGKKEDKKKKDKKNPELKDIKPDNYLEKMVRKLAQSDADSTCFNIFDVYKKAHGMASYPQDYDTSR